MQILTLPLQTISRKLNVLAGGGWWDSSSPPPLEEEERSRQSHGEGGRRQRQPFQQRKSNKQIQGLTSVSTSASSCWGKGSGAGVREYLDNFNIHLMEQEDGSGMMESLEFDEHGIPTVFYLNVNNFDGGHVGDHNGNAEEQIIGLGQHDVRLISSEDEPFTHHYSLQEDGTIQYHQQTTTSTSNSNGMDLGLGNYDANSVDFGDGSEQEHNFEFEEITTMPLGISAVEPEMNLNHFQLRLQPSNSSSSLTFPFAVTTTNSSSCFNSVSGSSSSVATTTNGHIILRQQLPQTLTQSSKSSSAQKRKLSSVSSRSSSIGDCNNPTNESGSSSTAIIQKRPKLLVNLYESDIGYEFGALLKDNKSSSQMSHLIPYSEDYLLRTLDREEIPIKVLAHLSPVLKWRRGHLLAQIRDYRRFSTGNITGKQHAPLSKGRLLQGNSRGNPKRCNPVITELVLRPTTQSLLADFEAILGKNRTNNWRKTITRPRSRPLSSEDEDDDLLQDSDYELELEEGSNSIPHLLSFEQRLELEKEFVNKTAGPICLDPSPMVAIIQNRIQFERLKWRCPSLVPKRRLTSMSSREQDEEGPSPVGTAAAFSKFIQRVKESNKDKDRPGLVKDDPLKLLSGSHELPFVEYPPLQPPSCMEEILKLGARPEPCTIRPLPIDNFIKKIEEYTLETERRKRPHTTKLSIFQRNGMDAYFGELEMESIQEGPSLSNNKPGGGNLKDSASTSTKCQFELGSSQSVALYVKQFSDIFTEDGRRPCKITYQKVGQPSPQVLYTNSYKTVAVAPGTTSSIPTTATTTSPSPGVLPNIGSTNPTPQPQSQPPVQIVHPQPRTAQPSEGQPTSTTIPLVVSNVTAQQPQILTRPQQGQQQQQQQLVQVQKPTVGPTNVPTASASHQQLLQQRLLVLKQQQQKQQQQQQQQPQTALAKLLLTNTNNSSTNNINSPSSRPITVAVQPQPQKASSEIGGQQLMTTGNVVGGPQQQNVNVNLNTGSGGQNHLSVNLNTMVLDGLISQNQLSQAQLRAHGHGQHQQGVNILRVNQGGGNQVVVSSGGSILSSQPQLITSSGIAGIQRHGQYTTSTNTNLSSLLHGQSHHGQRILINANNGQQLTLSSNNNSSTELEELSVPDLSSLLAGTSHQHLLATPHHQEPQHNLNLNLNLNLNSGSSLGLDSVNLNNHTQTPPPFLVFISPLRSVPVSINASPGVRGSSLLQQQLNAGPQAQQLSLSLDPNNPNTTIVTSTSSGNDGQGMEPGEYYTMGDGNGAEIKLEPVDHHHPSSSSSTVMIGNTAYSLNVSSSSGSSSVDNKKDVITLSSLLGSSNKSSSSSPLILQQQNNSQQGLVMSTSGGSSVLSSTPRLSALLAGTPSADSGGGSGTGLGLNSPGSRKISIGGHSVASPGNNDGSSRTLLDRLAASLSSSGNNMGSMANSSGISSTVTASGVRSGLNPIASATPNVVLDHPVLAATLTGQGQSPKLVSAYRQIAPAPVSNSSQASSRGKHP